MRLIINKRQKGLGKKFYLDFKTCLKALEINPYYQIRYDSIRCFPSKKFPFMIHFRVDETAKLVSVEAVISTHMNPEEEWLYETE
jgi:hypothetical protein